MFRVTGKAPLDTADQGALENRRDARAITSELTETLAVLVVPALLLSGFNLFIG